jgi:hypothetical protein
MFISVTKRGNQTGEFEKFQLTNVVTIREEAGGRDPGIALAK